MNKAIPPVIDRDAAVSLIEPLTDLVIRAGHAILAVNRSAMKVDGKTDGSPVTEADLAADRMIGEGLVDIYPRLSPTCEWDVAAGHAVVTAAGGRITDSKGAALHFGAGRKDFIVPEFIAWGDPAAAP